MNDSRSKDLQSRFRALHQAGCFVMPNPWDIGSAHLLAKLGFPALATTSAGFAWSIGRRDNVRKAYVTLKAGQELNLTGEAA